MQTPSFRRSPSTQNAGQTASGLIGPGAVGSQVEERLPMGFRLDGSGQLIEGSGQMVVNVGIIAGKSQSPPKGSRRPLVLAPFPHHATQVRSGLHVVLIPL